MTVPDLNPAVSLISEARLLAAAVKRASKATTTKYNKVLGGLRLSWLPNHLLQVSGFDYETAISVRVPFTGDPLPRDVLVPAKMFSAVLANLDPTECVSLAVHEDTLYCGGAGGKAKLHLMSLEDYPQLPKVPRGRAFTVSGRQLALISTKVTPFTSREQTLPVLMATRLELSDDGRLTAMATDRYRAAIGEVKVRMARTKQPVSMVVPHMKLVGTLFATAKTVVVTVGASRTAHNVPMVHFHNDELTVSLHLHVDGDFPRLRGIWPTEFEVSATVQPVEFLKALKFAETGCEPNGPVALDVGDNTITVTGRSGEDELSRTVEATTTGSLVMGFNPKYLAEAFKVFVKGPVTIEANDPRKPAQITSEAVPGLRVLQMPIRLNK